MLPQISTNINRQHDPKSGRVKGEQDWWRKGGVYAGRGSLLPPRGQHTVYPHNPNMLSSKHLLRTNKHIFFEQDFLSSTILHGKIEFLDTQLLYIAVQWEIFLEQLHIPGPLESTLSACFEEKGKTQKNVNFKWPCILQFCHNSNHLLEIKDSFCKMSQLNVSSFDDHL